MPRAKKPDWRLTFNLADKRLSDLDRAIRRFSKRPVYRPIIKRDARTGEQSVRAKLRHEVPETFAPMLREILDGWRMPLDQLVYALVDKHARNSKERQGSAFPICLTPEEFDLRLDSGALSNRAGRYKIRAVGSDAMSVIERLQPYQRGDEVIARTDPLAVLSALRNKQHQRLHVVMTQATEASFEIPVTQYVGEGFIFTEFRGLKLTTGPFDDGVEIIRLGEQIGPNPYPEVRAEFHPPFSVAFDPKGSGMGRPVLEVLNEIRQHILVNVFPPLESLL